MKKLRDETGTVILLITHDMGVVADMADRVAVMYAGRVIEQAQVDAIFSGQEHPYTKLLLSTIPRLEGEPKTYRPTIEGIVPDIGSSPDGCRFAPRCPISEDQCRAHAPPLSARIDVGAAACWRSQQVGSLV
nr:oligopeptide/dipeptide ABC transporter ATP-binding protein [Brucella sp. HL-2]